MILTTTDGVDGRAVDIYCGVVGAEIIFGANAWKDFVSGFVDALGGRNAGYEQVFEDARRQALSTLEEKAVGKGANAVLNVRFNYQVLGEKNGMLMVAATGTAVVLTKDQAELSLELKEMEDTIPRHYVIIEDNERGPFSTEQLRELYLQEKINDHTHTWTQDSKNGTPAGELLRANPPPRPRRF